MTARRTWMASLVGVAMTLATSPVAMADHGGDQHQSQGQQQEQTRKQEQSQGGICLGSTCLVNSTPFSDRTSEQSESESSEQTASSSQDGDSQSQQQSQTQSQEQHQSQSQCFICLP